jgi:hypothetical protein
MSDKAQGLAENIQQHVDAALASPIDKNALTALTRDALQLDGSIVYGESGVLLPTTSQAFRDSVQKDLQTLEAKGHLPVVTLDTGGHIDAGIKRPGTTTTDFNGRQYIRQNGRELVAMPDHPTEVWDF